MAVRTDRQRRKLVQHDFSLVFEGADVHDPGNLDSWFEAGCDDATFGEVDGVGYADFTRTSALAPEAILSAIDQLESAVPSVRVIRVEPDDLVTASDIAERLGRSRESVRLLVAGERGPGGFPPPISHLRSRGRLWRWAEVVRWAKAELDEVTSDTETPIFVAALNDALDLRRLGPEIATNRWRKVVLRLLPV